MTAAHIATLYFNESKEAAKKRLQKLKAAGLISERERLVSEPAVLFLAAKAFPLLHEHGILAQYPTFTQSALAKRAQVSKHTLRHELDIVDVKAAFHVAIKKTEIFAVEDFTTWPVLCEFEARVPGSAGREMTVRPDGFIRILERDADGGAADHTFFLEVDRSSEVLDVLTNRAGCYLEYYKSGGFALRNGAPRSAFKDHPFRVLIVLKSPDRRNNIAERLLQGIPPILTQVCLSTLDEVRADPLGVIWIQPRDYREATKGTVFDPEGRSGARITGRQTARDNFIEQNVTKRQILSEETDAANILHSPA